MKLHFWVTLCCGVLATGPLLALMLYIELSGDISARWLVVKFGAVILPIWVVFGASLLGYLVRLICCRKKAEQGGAE